MHSDDRQEPAEDGADEEQEERLWLAAQGQKMVIYSILLNFFLNALERSLQLPEVVNLGLALAVGFYTLSGIVKICSGLGKNEKQKLLFMVLAFFPAINIVVLVMLSIKTTNMLRNAGWTVGLLGARP